MATFADTITTLREERNKKRQEVADDLGISRASLEYYEKGKRKPDIDVLAKLADYYDVSADYLLGRTNAKTTDKDLRFVCDYTGLNEVSVNALNGKVFSGELKILRNTINHFLGKCFWVFLDVCDNYDLYHYYYLRYVETIIEMLQRTKKNEFITPNKETYDEMGLLKVLIDDLKDKRDVQRLRIQETLFKMLNIYCEDIEKMKKGAGLDEQTIEEAVFLFNERFLDLETEVFKNETKDGD